MKIPSILYDRQSKKIREVIGLIQRDSRFVD